MERKLTLSSAKSITALFGLEVVLLFGIAPRIRQIAARSIILESAVPSQPRKLRSISGFCRRGGGPVGAAEGSEQAKGLAQQSLSAGMRASRDNTALMLEEAARMNGAAVRKAFEEGITRMEETIEASRRIAWLSLAASAVAFMAAVCAIFVHVIH